MASGGRDMTLANAAMSATKAMVFVFFIFLFSAVLVLYSVWSVTLNRVISVLPVTFLTVTRRGFSERCNSIQCFSSSIVG